MVTKKRFFIILKFLVSFFALWYVFTEVHLNSIFHLFSEAKGIYLILGFLLFNISQLASTERLSYILKKYDTKIPFLDNLRLYYIGMAYNLFLPGGIGGDAFKILYINQNFEYPKKSLFSAVLFDRLLGLLAILLLISIGFSMMGFFYPPIAYILAILIVLGCAFFATHLIFKQSKSFGIGLLWSIAIQMIQGFSIACLALSFGIKKISVLLLFWISSIGTAVPIFLGGMGAREFIFEKFSALFGLNADLGLSIALAFSIITLISSSIGLILDFIPKKK